MDVKFIIFFLCIHFPHLSKIFNQLFFIYEFLFCSLFLFFLFSCVSFRIFFSFRFNFCLYKSIYWVRPIFANLSLCLSVCLSVCLSLSLSLSLSLLCLSVCLSLSLSLYLRNTNHILCPRPCFNHKTDILRFLCRHSYPLFCLENWNKHCNH